MESINLSSLKWLKNVKPERGWAYCSTDEMPIPEARIFRLRWRKDTNSISAPQKGELMVLVQLAKVTHIVELLDDEVYRDSEEEWGVYRVVKAVWMPPKDFDWQNLPDQQEAFGLADLPPNGYAHNLSQMATFNQYWQDRRGLEGFQSHLKTVLEDISSRSVTCVLR